MTRAQEAAIARVCAKECMARELIEALEGLLQIYEPVGLAPEEIMGDNFVGIIKALDAQCDAAKQKARAVLARAKEQS